MRIAIFWPNSAALRRGASRDFEIALSMLTDLVALLADDTATDGNAKLVSVVLT
jgi:hypothetical protein